MVKKNWTKQEFQAAVLQGMPKRLPPAHTIDPTINHAPCRPNNLTLEQKKLALQNALRYIPRKWHKKLAPEFAKELKTYGRIYMMRFKPRYPIKAYPLDWYPGNRIAARAMQLMYMNNLDVQNAQYPDELVTYGGTGTVFQNWVQYLIAMQALATMTEEQSLKLYSGHLLGKFPARKGLDPMAVIANGLMSAPAEATYDDLAALGVTMYGQMTAGSAMYIGSQGIVHGTFITLLYAFRKYFNYLTLDDIRCKLFVSSGLGGMSGAQGKAAQILKLISVIAEINPLAIDKRLKQGWIDRKTDDLDEVIAIIKDAIANQSPISLGYQGNIVDLLEKVNESDIFVHLVSDQTSLNLPHSGGYYPVGLEFEKAVKMISANQDKFKSLVSSSLRRHTLAINEMTANTDGEYNSRFFDYGNGFLKEARDAESDILGDIDGFRYPSYVKDLMGPYFFDYGFGPYRWVCLSGDPEDLRKTDELAVKVMRRLMKSAPAETKKQYEFNLYWIEKAAENKLVVGSQARILYSDRRGRTALALAFNKAIRNGEIGPVVLGRDHHDVGGTDSKFRETANISDGSNVCADMSVQNFVCCAIAQADWISLHNGGGVGWNSVINGGFGMALDGSRSVDKRIKILMAIDVNNGLARRAWAGNPGAMFAIQNSMDDDDRLQITMPEMVVDDGSLDKIIDKFFN